MQTVAVAEPVQKPPYHHFRKGIAPLDSAHVGASAVRAKMICHG
jgi:hypothetical protein